MQLDLNDVQLFSEVVAAGSFTAAGKALGLPVSTVSRRVARLENALGTRLLQRTTRRLGLTDAGRVYLERAAQALSLLHDAEDALAERQGEPRGRVRVSAPLDMTQALARVTARFLARHARVQVELVLDNRFVDLVAEGFDLALRAGRLSDSSLVARRLGGVATHLVASPRYLAARGTPARVAELREHECIVYGGAVAAPSWLVDGASVALRARLFVNELAAVRDATLEGLGIAALPSSICADEVARGTLVRVLPDVDAGQGTLALVYPSGAHLAPAVRAYLDFAADALPPLLLATVPAA